MMLRILWVATKAPWPPRDGGRLLQLETLRLLAAAPEVEVTLVAPAPHGEHAAIEAALGGLCVPRLVDARPRPLPVAVVLGALRGEPVSAVRHRLSTVQRVVAAVASKGSFDVVHAEQAQAMPQALAAGRPILLRAQNVESELWRAGAPRSAPAALVRREADRLARWEGAMATRAALTAAVTERDAAALSVLAPRARVETLPVPFQAELPAGPPLPGPPDAPAFVVLVGAGWRPNREGAEAFVASTWPRVLAEVPSSRLHVFGEVDAATRAAPAVTWHPAPDAADVAFARDAILVVPLEVASGVRMKVLEAWARGVPVAATPEAAAGLGATPGNELAVAALGTPLAVEMVALARDAELRARRVRAGRALLARRHAPAEARRRLLAAYVDACASAPAPRG
jgi:hypothetical protein